MVGVHMGLELVVVMVEEESGSELGVGVENYSELGVVGKVEVEKHTQVVVVASNELVVRVMVRGVVVGVSTLHKVEEEVVVVVLYKAVEMVVVVNELGEAENGQ